MPTGSENVEEIDSREAAQSLSTVTVFARAKPMTGKIRTPRLDLKVASLIHNYMSERTVLPCCVVVKEFKALYPFGSSWNGNITYNDETSEQKDKSSKLGIPRQDPVDEA
jgi:hypothetical protein